MTISLENEIIALWENTTLRDELADEPADALLKWGEQRLTLLANATPDEFAFEEKSKQLRILLKAINRFIGRRNVMAEEEQAEAIQKIMGAAAALNFPVQPGAESVYNEYQRKPEHQQQAADVDNIRALTSFLETGMINNLPGDNSGSTQHLSA